MAEIGNIKNDPEGREIFIYIYLFIYAIDTHVFFRRSEELISILRIYHVNLGLLTWLEQKDFATIDASTHDLMPR